MRSIARNLTLALCTAAALASTACSSESERAADHTTAAASPDATSTVSAGAGAGYPDFDEEDYSYRLEVLCYCPMTGPVQVVVKDGKVSDATVLEGRTAGAKGGGGTTGADAPEFMRLTINDIIAMANDTGAAAVDVTWPEGQAWPDTVAIDRIPRATDDEVTYTIRDVVVSAG